MASSRRMVTYAGAVSEALKKHHGSRVGAERSLDDLFPGDRTRIFDSNDTRQVNISDAVSYFAEAVSREFGKQMAGKKLIKVNINSVAALLQIINNAANEFIFRDIVISSELEKIENPVVRTQCKRDLVVAFVNTALGRVNADAATSLEPGTDAYLNASAYRAFCIAVTNCNDKQPEDALMMVRDGARTVMKDAMLRQLGIIKNDTGSLTIPDSIVGNIKSFDYKELLKNGVVTKNMPLLEDSTEKTFKHIMRDVIIQVYRELRKQDAGKANLFIDGFDDKTRDYVETQMRTRFASIAESTQGVFGVSAAVRAAAVASPFSSSSAPVSPLKNHRDSMDSSHDSPRSHTQRVITPKRGTLFTSQTAASAAEAAATSDSSDLSGPQELKDEKRPLERATTSTRLARRKPHK